MNVGSCDINYGVERVIILLMHLGILVSFLYFIVEYLRRFIKSIVNSKRKKNIHWQQNYVNTKSNLATL